MSDPRIQAVLEAAGQLFIIKGYANTQVSQIAAAANIATGTVYNLYAGKKSILHSVLLYSLDKHYLSKDRLLPITEVEDELLINRLSTIVEDLLEQIRLKDDKPRQSFADMLSILFDFVASYHVAFNIINDNRDAVVEVEKKYRNYVNELYTITEENIMCFIEQGGVRQVELPKLHIRNIFEGITWWGMYLPYHAPGMIVPVHKAKEIALDILKHAYLTKPE